MKILFLEAVQNYGGARKSAIELATRLQNKDNDVLIVDYWGSCKPFVEAAQKNNIQIQILDKRDKPILLSSNNRLKQITNYIVYFRKWMNYRNEITKIIRKFKPQIIVVNNTKTLSILSNKNNYRIAYFARGWFLPKTISKFNRFIIKRLVDIYIGVSQSTRQAIYAGGFATLENIYVVPNAIDYTKMQKIKTDNACLSDWHLESKDRPFVIMHCGGFLPSKGQHITVEVAKELKDQNINFKVLMVGIIYKGYSSEKYYKQLLDKIKQYELENYFKIVLNENDVIRYFTKIDVLIHPSETEGLPRVVMEAMAMGKPVIGNPVGGMTDYILHGFTGFLTDNNSVNDYVKYSIRLKNDRELYSFLSNNATQLIKNCYTFENQIFMFSKIGLK